jgi:hypothetical protein
MRRLRPVLRGTDEANHDSAAAAGGAGAWPPWRRWPGWPCGGSSRAATRRICRFPTSSLAGPMLR